MGDLCLGKTIVGIVKLDEISKELGCHIDGIIGQNLLREFDSVSIEYKRGVVVFVKQVN